MQRGGCYAISCRILPRGAGTAGAALYELYAYATPQPARGVTVNALRCTPEWFARMRISPLKRRRSAPRPLLPRRTWKPGRHPWHHAGVFYAQEPSASAPAALLDVHPGMRWRTSAPRRAARPASWRRLCRGRACCWPTSLWLPAPKILRQNLERMGVTNAVITNEDTARLAAAYPASLTGCSSTRPAPARGCSARSRRRDPAQ